MKIILFLSCLIFFESFSQSAIQSTSTKSQLEIDRLYSKYKNIESTTIYFPSGSLNGTVSIEMNDNNKPREISISGKTNNVKELAQFICYYIKQKVNKGFKQDNEFSLSTASDANFIEINLESFDHEVRFSLLKGNEYTTIFCYQNKMTQNYHIGDFSMPKLTYVDDFSFVLTTGDMRRIAGSNTKPFDF